MEIVQLAVAANEIFHARSGIYGTAFQAVLTSCTEIIQD